MSCSYPEHRRHRRGLSLLEVLISMVIFGLAMVPVVRVFSTANRVSFQADRLLGATLHGQVLLEAVGQLRIDELPPVAPGTESVLYSEDSGIAGGGSGRWVDELPAFLEGPPPFPLERELVGRRLPTGEMQLVIHLSWLALPGKEETRRELTMVSLTTPDLWMRGASSGS